MTEFKTPTSKRSRLMTNSELQTPLKIPSSPFLEQIGYGCGVSVFTLERSPRVGFARSPWAIKKRNPKVLQQKKYDDRIRFEADILRKLNHPNIVGYRGFASGEKGEPCLAMEKLDISLGDLIEKMVEDGKPPFPAKDIQTIAFEVAKGLEYLHHSMNVLHGDVKSYNILLTKDYKSVKLCDFGVSLPLTKDLQLDTTKNQLRYYGTECWNAPEVFREDGPISNKTDVWAYGLTIWEMIALSPPHVELEESLNSSILDTHTSFVNDNLNESKENEDSSFTDDSLLSMVHETPDTYGTRPALPAYDLGAEYQRVLELFYVCTDEDPKTRPSAKGVVNFFNKFFK